MRNPVMRALREAVRAEISNAFEVIGHARPREVARSAQAGVEPGSGKIVDGRAARGRMRGSVTAATRLRAAMANAPLISHLR